MSFNKVNSDGSLTRVAGGTLYADAPVGAIMPYGGTTAPDGFLLCQGQAVSRTTYAELFKVIGTAFGAGDGSITFNVPDLRETVPVGSGTRGNGVTDHDTYTVGQFKDDQKQTHTHTISHTHTRGTMDITGSLTNYNATNAASGYYDASGAFVHNGVTGSYAHSPVPSGDVNVLGIDFIASRNWTGNTSEPSNANSGNDTGRTGTTTHGKQLGVNYIIKATQVGAPADLAPVDVVENGNMKAVTSNAVYDTLMNITTLTPTKTANVGIIYEAEFLRIGRLVFVNLNLIVSSGILFTGLPKPTSRQTFTINGFYETDKALRLIVNTNGSIETDNSSTITNQNVGGHIVYITAE